MSINEKSCNRVARLQFYLFVFVCLYTIGCNGNGGLSGNGGSDGSGGSSWTFTEDNTDLGISGVSPEAFLLDDWSVRLYVTDMGMIIYRAGDGLAFTRETASLPPGSDPTLVRLEDDTYRMYYVSHEQGVGEIWTATSPDGLNWTTESGTGIRNTTGGPAWGVPDSIELPNGWIRLYWVDMPSESNEGDYEVVRSALSSDGIVFTEEEGYRTEDGYVDPYILFAEDGSWAGLFATTPSEERLPQVIYIGYSTDGLTWVIESEPIITISGGNAFDPTAVPLGDGSYRVYYCTTTGSDPFSGFFLKSGIIRKK